MMASRFRAGSELPVRSVTANNFAFESENRMHSDEVAAEYGFKGGLVPGVGVFAYMTQPIVEAVGREWLERGRIHARFIKPVYHQERVTVHAKVVNESPPGFKVEVRNAEGVPCGAGEAHLPDEPPPAPDDAMFPRVCLPPRADRLPADVSAIVPGKAKLGSLEFDAVWQRPVEGPQAFLAAVCDPLEAYHGANAACHPALIVAQANQLLKENIALGPWIHTASDVQYFALPAEGARLSLRGNVVAAYVKHEHEFVEVDLAMFDAGERPLARIHHVAIIRPARRKS